MLVMVVMRYPHYHHHPPATVLRWYSIDDYHPSLLVMQVLLTFCGMTLLMRWWCAVGGDYLPTLPIPGTQVR